MSDIRRILRLLVPRLGSKDVMHIFYMTVSPNGVVHSLPPQSLEGVVHVRQGHPPMLKESAEQRLVGEIHIDGLAVHAVENVRKNLLAGVHDLQAAVHVG